MPPERRSLRSNNKSDTSANGDKARTNSQNSSSNKDKTAPARSAPAKTRSATAKKSASKNTGEEQPHTNGADPVENGVNGTDDVEMKEDAPANGSAMKQQKDNDGDEEMTVVVPETKGSGQDKEGDVDMGESGNEAGEKTVEEVDPKTKAVTGMTCHLPPQFATTRTPLTDSRLQTSRIASHFSREPLPTLTRDLLFGL